MSILIDILSIPLVIGGSLICLVGGIGLIRLPDFYSRIHAAGLTDTMGATMLLVGLSLQSGFNLVSVKILIIMLFVVLVSPMSSHALAKAAFSNGLKPKLHNDWTTGRKEDTPSYKP